MPTPDWPLRTDRLMLRPFREDDFDARLVENEWVKGEWQSELVYALLDREWRARAEARSA